MTMPLVSVLVTVYNGANYVRECLNAILAQTYPNVEIIIVDDGSNDGTPAIIERDYGNKVLLIKQKNQKVAMARHNGMQYVKGEYIAFCDHDDVWQEGKISKQVSCLESNIDCVLVHTDAIEESVLTGKRERYSQLHPRIKKEKKLISGIIHHYDVPLYSTMMLRKEFINKFEISFASLPQGVDDIGVILEVLLRNGTCRYIDEPLVIRKMREGSISANYLGRFQQRILLYKYLVKKYHQIAGTLNIRELKWGVFDAAYRTADHLLYTKRTKEAKNLFYLAWRYKMCDIRPLIKYLLFSVFSSDRYQKFKMKKSNNAI